MGSVAAIRRSCPPDLYNPAWPPPSSSVNIGGYIWSAAVQSQQAIQLIASQMYFFVVEPGSVACFPSGIGGM